MKKTLVLTGATLALAFANLASANVVVLDNPAVSAGTGIYSGDFVYTYSVQLDGQQQFLGYPLTNVTATGPEEYCIANIDGLVAGSASISPTTGFAVTQGASGGCNIFAGTLPGQNVGAWVKVVYTGSTTYAPSSVLPSITFVSLYPVNASDNTAYGGTAYNKTANTNGTFNTTSNQGEIAGPQSNVPEPATMTLFGSALLGIGFFARKRTKKN